MSDDVPTPIPTPKPDDGFGRCLTVAIPAGLTIWLIATLLIEWFLT